MAILWEPPVYQTYEFSPKRTRYCFIVVIWNEGDRIRGQLARMKERAGLADIIIADGNSTDGSTEHNFLRNMGVRTLLVTDEPGLCTATRMALAYAIEQGYEGVITIDGNGKDGVEALPDFIKALDDGYDLIQGSRFMKGGFHKNTPLYRSIGVQYVVAPVLAMGGGYWYTDPTNAFRAMSMRFLKDERVQPIRKIFVRFNLQHYVNYRAAKLKMKVKEIPVTRVYPDDGSVPTKITGFRMKSLIHEMVVCALGGYDPKE
jgi:dolichol-phosphate mannosyltransferase